MNHPLCHKVRKSTQKYAKVRKSTQKCAKVRRSTQKWVGRKAGLARDTSKEKKKKKRTRPASHPPRDPRARRNEILRSDPLTLTYTPPMGIRERGYVSIIREIYPYNNVNIYSIYKIYRDLWQSWWFMIYGKVDGSTFMAKRMVQDLWKSGRFKKMGREAKKPPPAPPPHHRGGRGNGFFVSRPIFLNHPLFHKSWTIRFAINLEPSTLP